MASGKTIRVNLAFGADTKAAKQQIQQLQQSLSQLASQPIGAGMGKAYTQELHNAKNAAIELKIALNNAVNVNTGKLNFNKFNQELKQSKMTLTDYAAQLAKLGPQGAESFMQLTRAIASSQTPLLQLKGQMAKLGQAMANTIRWQITSSLTTGLMSAFSSVIQYSEELNESLTNIRIVTGKSAEEMSVFAKEANKAAKELSTTTTKYTNASLIYYQQGLSDSEVKQRTDITVKLANVVGENAETVSEWMTAIWNNFDNGSASMEHYADVLAKLGAATASSADEIAGGLEKFAAVAETVGLSYEYAAAALATITAETRQSEDVVGTALKTIFARIENLELGETLEDGVDLGQYSLALQKVGVDILDANGNLKDMNTILDNIGLTWQNLEQQEKVALAQSVAGIRQYNQFMALMENWDVMKRNVELAEEANGALEEQYKIYETGIEGAQARIQDQLEKIKNTLLDEDDLIPLLNIADKFLSAVSNILDAVGGLPTILTLVANLMLRAFGPQVAAGLQTVVVSVKGLINGLTGVTQKTQSEMIQEATEAYKKEFLNSAYPDAEQANVARQAAFGGELEIATKLETHKEALNSLERERFNHQQQILKQAGEELVKQGEIADEIARQAQLQQEKLEAMGSDFTNEPSRPGSSTTAYEEFGKYYENEVGFLNASPQDIKKYGKFNSDTEKQKVANLFELPAGADPSTLNGYDDYIKKAEAAAKAQQKLARAQATGKGDTVKLTQAVRKANIELRKSKEALLENNKEQTKSNQIVDKAKKLANKKHGGANKKAAKEERKAIDDLVAAKKKDIETTSNLNNKTEEFNENIEKTGEQIDEAGRKGLTGTKMFVAVTQSITSMLMGVQMLTSGLNSMADAFKDGFDFGTFISGLSSSLMGVLSLARGMTDLNDTIKQKTGLTIAESIATGLSTMASKAKQKAEEAEQKQGQKTIKTTIANAWANVANGIAKHWVTGLAVAGIVAAILGGAAIAGNISAKSQKEQDEKTVEQNQENIDSLNDLDEQTKSVRELTEAYRELEESEQDTLEAQKDIAEALPGLIEKYKELESKLGIDFGSSELQKLLDTYEVTGELNVGKVEEILESADQKSAQASWDAAQANAAIQTRQALETQKGSNDGNVKSGKYVVRMGGAGAEEEKSSKILKDVMGDDWTGTKLTVKTGSASELVESYQKMIKARDRMAKELTQEELNASDTYRELNREIGELKESAEAAQASLNEMFVSAQTLFTEDKAETLKKEEKIEDYSSYVNKRADLLEQLKEDYPGLTEEEYQQLLQGNPVFKELELIYQITINDEGKEIDTELSNKVKRIADTLTAEEYTIFLQVDADFIKSHTEEEILAEIERIQNEIAAAARKAARLEQLEAQKTAQDLEKEIDRYHYIESVIEDLEKDYTELGKLKDRAYGPNKLKYITSEIGSLNSQIEAQKALNEQTNKYLEIDKKRIAGMGAKFDEYGNVTNVTELQASYVNRLNKLDKDSTDYKALENEFKLFETYLSNYENSLKQAEDGMIKLNDLEFDKLEKELEKIDNAVQNSVQLTEQELKGIDFQLSKIEDSAYAAAEKIALLGKSAAANSRTAEANLKGIQDVLSNKGIDYNEFVKDGFDMSSLGLENFTAAEIEQLLGYQDKLISSTQEVRQNWLDMHAAIDETFDDMQEDLDSVSEKMEHQIGLLENYNNLIDLVGAKNLGLSNEDLAMLDEAMVSGSQEQIKQARNRLNASTKVLADYEEQLKKAEASGDQERIDEWKEKVKTAQQQVMEDQNAVNEALANSIEIAQAARERAVNTALEEFLQIVTGFSNIEDMQNQYDQQKQINELYLKDYEKAYELAKLTRKIEQSATDSSSVRVKQKLAELQERIAEAQADGEKMSRYELENLQRQYDLELARAAMEDAQYAKRQVRLRQDSEGSWGYVYTADQAVVDNAQQKYEDAVYAIMSANDEYMQSSYESMMQANEWLNTTITEIMSRQDLTAAEQQAMIDEATEHYLQLQQFYTSELDLVLSNNKDLYNSEKETQNENIDLMIKKNEDYVNDIFERFNPELQKALIGDEDSALSYYKELKTAIGGPGVKGSLYGDLAQANVDYEKNVDQSFNDAGLEINDFKNYLNTEVPKITSEINKITEEFKDITEEGTNSLSTATQNLTNWETANKPKLENMEKAVEELTFAITNMITEWQKLANESDISKQITITKTETYVASTGSSSGTTTNDDTPEAKFSTGDYVGTGGKVAANYSLNSSRSTISLITNQQSAIGSEAITDSYYGKGSKSWYYKIGNTWYKESDLEKSLTIKQFGTYDNGYAAVQLSDGNWYTSRAAGGATSASKAIGDTVTLMTGAEALDERRLDSNRPNVNESLGAKYNLASSKIYHKDSSGKIVTDNSNITGFASDLRYYNTIAAVQQQDNDWFVQLKQSSSSPFIYGNNAWFKLAAFETGGYTGDWGPEGRLAMLHQKEIVLNAHDTENMLATVQIVRSIADQLELNARATQQGLSGYLAAASIKSVGDTIEQNVTIYAEFPNATDHSEIEEAFRNLSNLASQYAFKS